MKKITLTQFFTDTDELAIHCNTEQEANTLLNAFDTMGKKWDDGTSYLKNNEFTEYKCNTCYSNDGYYCERKHYIREEIPVYEFDEVELK